MVYESELLFECERCSEDRAIKSFVHVPMVCLHIALRTRNCTSTLPVSFVGKMTKIIEKHLAGFCGAPFESISVNRKRSFPH